MTNSRHPETLSLHAGWRADATTGSVAVGPYVRVNNLDCRDFTHTVKVGGKDYVKKGTACREQNGNWAVEQGAA